MIKIKKEARQLETLLNRLVQKRKANGFGAGEEIIEKIDDLKNRIVDKNPDLIEEMVEELKATKDTNNDKIAVCIDRNNKEFKAIKYNPTNSHLSGNYFPIYQEWAK